MGNIGFDRLTQALAGSSARRHALRASLGGALATATTRFSDGASAKPKTKQQPTKKKHGGKQKCLKPTQSCKTVASCSGAEFGVVACRAYPVDKQNCPTDFPGLRCCGLDGVLCDTNLGNCGCCDESVCTLVGGEFRCQPSEP